ncbi:uncharacterized protein LOC131248299 isoform X2 [Magnolia sinica]|uniref:uncharacterized protein LOC131248299 isoform X2 n=1 Tax=Magnolia sinica TaxID=86752 RepID=UPI0026594797|nr:uncharacterized protein LOC131248299 isoform X2 [Magnolia sinica]
MKNVNLKPEKMRSLAKALPDSSRPFDDGLYRALDIYFKSCPASISELVSECMGSLLEDVCGMESSLLSFGAYGMRKIREIFKGNNSQSVASLAESMEAYIGRQPSSTLEDSQGG